MRSTFLPRSMVEVVGSSPFFCQYASRTGSATSGWRSAAKEARRLIGTTPRRTAMRAIATTSAVRVHRSGATWLEALAVESAVNLGQTGELVINGFAQSLRGRHP